MKKTIQTATCLTLIGALSLFPCSAFALTKDETVYAKLHDNGGVDYVSVVEHLINNDKSATIKDSSNLNNIENLNGFEEFSANGAEVVWSADGKDIYYSGESNQELPIKMNISYKLNGEAKSADEILGKSGRVEMRLKFTNLSKVGDLYTPFAVAVATTLPEPATSNVSVTNGEATSNGRTIAVAAVAAPGLYESLGLSELQNFDEVTITYDTESVELSDIYAVVTPEILNREDLKTFEQLDELFASTNKLSTSSQALVSGSTKLRDGVAELKSNISTLKTKFQSQTNLLDAATIAQIKATAGAAAEQQAAANSTTIRTAVHQQISSNTILLNALKLQAAEMCTQQYGTCTDAMITGFYQTLINGVEEQLVASSLEVAKTTARQTAEATAESVATQLATTIENQLSTMLSTPLNTLENALDRLLVGVNELNSGIYQFDQQGIQPLANFVNGKVRITSDRIKQLTELAAQYNNYAGIAENTTGTTKFIYMVEGKKPEQEN